MRIDLALQHPVFVVFLLAFIFDALIHQGQHIFGQIIDILADVAQFVLPFCGCVPGKIPVGNPLHPYLQLPYRFVDGL